MNEEFYNHVVNHFDLLGELNTYRQIYKMIDASSIYVVEHMFHTSLYGVFYVHGKAHLTLIFRCNGLDQAKNIKQYIGQTEVLFV